MAKFYENKIKALVCIHFSKTIDLMKSAFSVELITAVKYPVLIQLGT